MAHGIISTFDYVTVGSSKGEPAPHSRLDSHSVQLFVIGLAFSQQRLQRFGEWINRQNYGSTSSALCAP